MEDTMEDTATTSDDPNLRSKSKKSSASSFISNKLNNKGLKGRELGLFWFVILGCVCVLISTLIQNIVSLFEAESNPATSVSYEQKNTYPNVSFLLCPHFTTTIDVGGYSVRPHLEIFTKRTVKEGANPTSKFTSSSGDKLDGETFKFNSNNLASTMTVEPEPIGYKLFRNTTSGCIAMTPTGIDTNVTEKPGQGPQLSNSLNLLYNNLDQDQIAQVTVGLYCTVSENNGPYVRDNRFCSGLYINLLVSAFSTEKDDYNHSKSLAFNLQNSCGKKNTDSESDKLCTNHIPGLSDATQVPPQRKGLLALEVTETRTPRTNSFCMSECGTKSHFEQ